MYSFGMGFWGPNGHDGIWHLALANQALSGFPPPHPTFAGATLTNYHYFFDLLLAFFGKITFIPLVNLYFQVLPLLFALGLGILSFLVGFYWQKNFWVGWWLAFFNYFAGSFGFLVTFWRTREIGGESLFWAMQSSSALINPPFALSLIFLLLIIYLLLSIKVWNWKKIVLVGCLLGILPSIKVYAGIIGFSGLLIFAWRKFLKKEVAYAKILSVSCLVAVATFFPINRQPAGLLVFEPFWFIHSMIESPDRLFLPRLASMRQVFQASAYEKLVIIELIGLLIFLVGNLGTRVVALFSLWRKVIEKNLDDLDIFLLVGGFISLLFPLLFIQKGTPWNMIQFFYYFLFFANFYAAVFFARLVATRRIGWLVILVILTIPTTVSSLRGYLGWPPPAAIPPSELEALAFLAKQKDKTVLTYPYDAYLKKDVELAKKVVLSDPKADKLRNLVQDELINDYMAKDPSTAPRAVLLLLIARHLERICDHTTNIAEDVIYMVGGKVVKHHPEELG